MICLLSLPSISRIIRLEAFTFSTRDFASPENYYDGIRCRRLFCRFTRRARIFIAIFSIVVTIRAACQDRVNLDVNTLFADIASIIPPL